MTDRDNITLPREVVEGALEALCHARSRLDHAAAEMDCNASVDALRTALAAEQPKPVVIAKDWLKMTLRVNRGDRVLKVERWLHLSEIKQSHFPLVPETADSAWQELNAAMGDKT